MRFKLLRGKHSEGGVLYHFKDNPIIESDVDLVEKFNFRNSRKFIRLTDAGPLKTISKGAGKPTVVVDRDDDDDDNDETASTTSESTASSTGHVVSATELNSMTKAQLEEFALDHNIDTEGLTTKKDILDEVRKNLGI